MRECGVLLPVSSLPSRYGIGAFSKEAYAFVDTLKEAGQSYWQILPLGPTGFGDSPYQAYSAFAGNPYFIDLEALVEEKILKEEECDAVDFGTDKRTVDYEKVAAGRKKLLRLAYDRWKMRGCVTSQQVTKDTEDYCTYMAIKDHFQGKSWVEWDEDIKLRKPEALAQYRNMLANEIGYYRFQQLKFQEQWQKLRAYANSQGIKIIGDIPIYVAFDSSDSWANPELFQFDEKGHPISVAGCPPDGFSPTGQHWGNPLYRWEKHKEIGYDWWLRRMEYSFTLYDVMRVDHFRGFDEYYAIPADHKTAEHGWWEKGPGLDIFKKMEEAFGHLNIIAEDLGFLTPSVVQLVKDTGFPSMKVLEFAFDSGEENTYLPHNYEKNSVVYTGTHDNDTVVSWFEAMEEDAREFALEYMNCPVEKAKDIHWELIRLALASVSDLAIIPVQDYLGLGGEARINEPSTVGKNWQWRMLDGEITQETAGKMKKLAKLYGRVR